MVLYSFFTGSVVGLTVLVADGLGAALCSVEGIALVFDAFGVGNDDDDAEEEVNVLEGLGGAEILTSVAALTRKEGFSTTAHAGSRFSVVRFSPTPFIVVVEGGGSTGLTGSTIDGAGVGEGSMCGASIAFQSLECRFLSVAPGLGAAEDVANEVVAVVVAAGEGSFAGVGAVSVFEI